MTKLVYGVGINDGKYPARVNGKQPKEYTLWSDLLKRCCGPKAWEKFPTYIDCSVSENFKKYSYFHDWCQEQKGFGVRGYQLDKDLILKGNKLYSEDTCLFVPRDLNVLLLSCKSCRGSFPLGVSAHQGKFIVHCSTNKSSSHVGYYNTVEEAFQAYKQAKEAFIKLQAEKWRDFIDPRAYEALMRYEVLITD